MRTNSKEVSRRTFKLFTYFLINFLINQQIQQFINRRSSERASRPSKLILRTSASRSCSRTWMRCEVSAITWHNIVGMRSLWWTIRVDWIRCWKKLSGSFQAEHIKQKDFKFFFNCRTEFHIKFLWGCKGAFVAGEERHLKFEQVLGMMADKLANQNEFLTSVNA